MTSALDRLLAKIGKTRAGLTAAGSRSRAATALRRQGVDDSQELRRILELPRRVGPPPDLTDLLVLSGGRQRLRAAQSLALADLYEVGLVAPMPVGSGKTLVTLLAAYVLESKRPVLLVPAALRERTRRSAREAAEHWPVVLPTLLGYEALGRVAMAEELDRLDPDLLIADEAHYLRNRDAARTRRVERFLDSHPNCKFVPLSGTLDAGSLLDCAHLYAWALRHRSPLPIDESTAIQWSKAIDAERWDHGQRLAPGALRLFCDANDETDAPAKALVRHIRDSPGVVNVHTEECRASLTISRWRPPVDAATGAAIRAAEQTSVRPDGEPMTPSDLARFLSMRLFGCWYRWDPLPPLPWLAARRDWCRFVRELKGTAPSYDSEKQVALAHPGRFEAWDIVRKTYKPRVVTVWETTEPIDAIREWAGDDGIVWSQYRAVAEKLQLPFFSTHGLCNGRHIEQARGPVLASIRACGKGAHLVQYSRALVISPPASCEPWQQLIGRHHRAGQKSDEVHFDIASGVRYIDQVIDRVRSEADRLTVERNDTQKLSIATWM